MFTEEAKPIASREIQTRGLRCGQEVPPSDARQDEGPLAAETSDAPAAKQGWKRFFLHAAIMLLANWLIYIMADALATGRVPTGLRSASIMAAESIGYYFVALAISFTALSFNTTAGWIAWVVTIGYFTYGIFRHAAA